MIHSFAAEATEDLFLGLDSRRARRNHQILKVLDVAYAAKRSNKILIRPLRGEVSPRDVAIALPKGRLDVVEPNTILEQVLRLDEHLELFPSAADRKDLRNSANR